MEKSNQRQQIKPIQRTLLIAEKECIYVHMEEPLLLLGKSDFSCIKDNAEKSEQGCGRTLPDSKHVHQRLAHEVPYHDVNGDGYHCTSNVNPIA